MHAIGGYFELELNNKYKEFHNRALVFNTGSNALKALVQARGYKKLYLPNYICESVYKSLESISVEYEFYNINPRMKPLFEKHLPSSEALLYVNYFGICDAHVTTLSKKYKQLIIDNTQAFFSRPLGNVDTFYSCRKFFGVPDGAYLYSNANIPNYPLDQSFMRFSHLLKRADLSAEEGYTSYLRHEEQLMSEPIRMMSKITSRIMQSIDYSKVSDVRRKNFTSLNNVLYSKNLLKPTLGNINVPMSYPYVTNQTGLREWLRENKIYTATYWKEVSDRCDLDSVEHNLSNNLISIPIDQRYNEEDMQRIISLIKNYE